MKYLKVRLVGNRVSEFRLGISMIGVAIVLVAIGLLLTLLCPWIVRARESARRAYCQANLRQLGTALNAYHDTYQRLPYAAVWSSLRLKSLALHKSRRFDLFTCANWAQALLPFADQASLAAKFDSDWPIADIRNLRGRNERPGMMVCPSDHFSSPQNEYRLSPNGRESISFARGNYAINGGSHCFNEGAGSTAYLTGDNAHLEMNRTTREFRWWGNGVAGFNVFFAYDDFENGSGSLVMLDELRAGVDSIDPRGVWALGQIGGSVTWGHGVNGDAYGPNNQESKADDLLDGDMLNRKVGAEYLRVNHMPCVSYVNLNYQATSRSAHPGGVNVLLVDGASRFVADAIDPGLWHVMHSRETPRNLLDHKLDSLIASSFEIPEKSISQSDVIRPDEDAERMIENSAKMRFVLIPAGEFEMGLADENNSDELPVESPQHHVQISSAFYLGIHEVTQDQYLQIAGELPAGYKPPEEMSPSEISSGPITGVTWHEADEFCRKLSVLPAERAAARRYRLPTECEWEYACRAGNKSPYRWLAERLPKDNSGDTAGIKPPLPLRSVGSYPPNGFGVFDMRGNCWEWCADWFDRDYYARSSTRDPMGPQDGYIKVVRGGSWTFIGEKCKLSYSHLPPWKSSPLVGFRVVCEMYAGNSTLATK